MAEDNPTNVNCMPRYRVELSTNIALIQSARAEHTGREVASTAMLRWIRESSRDEPWNPTSRLCRAQDASGLPLGVKIRPRCYSAEANVGTELGEENIGDPGMQTEGNKTKTTH